MARVCACMQRPASTENPLCWYPSIALVSKLSSRSRTTKAAQDAPSQVSLRLRHERAGGPAQRPRASHAGYAKDVSGARSAVAVDAAAYAH